MALPTPPPCTSAGCFLQQNGGLVSFPLVTLAGLIDGVNPCAIGMLVLLLGYLIVFAKKEKQVFKIGLFYILTVYITYFAVGLLFYKSAALLSQSAYSFYFRKFLGMALFLAGLINLKDFIFVHWGGGIISPDGDTAPMNALSKLGKKIINFHLEVPGASKDMLMRYVEKSTVPATIILGILVTLLESPCSLPIYVGTATILAESGLSPVIVLGYILYYNFLFVLPLIILWQVVLRTRRLVEVKEWEHKAKKWMKLSLGLLLVIMGIWMIK